MKIKKPKAGSTLALIGWELRQRRWSLLWWSAGFGVLVALIMLVYPAFDDQAAQLNESLAAIPDSAKQLFTDTADLFSPVGYLSSQLFYLMMPILFIWLAISLGSSVISREERSTTIELLLSRPVSRGRLVLAKSAAAFLAYTIVSVVVVIVALSCASAVEFKGVAPENIALTTVMSAALGLVFGAVALFVTALGRLGRLSAIAVASLVAVASYLASSLDTTVRWLQTPAKFMPFHYYHPANMLEGGFAPKYLALFLAVTLACGVLAWLVFRRRDLE